MAKGRALRFLHQLSARSLEFKDTDYIFPNQFIRKYDQPDSQVVVLDYMTTDDTLYAFLSYRDELHILKRAVKYAELKARIKLYREEINRTIGFLKNYDVDDLKKHHTQLKAISSLIYKSVLHWPVLNNILREATHIYIIPDEFLFELPFSTLVLEDGGNDKYLADMAAIIQVPGRSFLPWLGKKSFEKKELPSRVLISADPSFLGTKDVVSFLKKTFPDAEELYISEGSDLELQLKKLENRYEVLFFVGHGSADRENSEISFLEFTARKKPGSGVERFRLSMKDLYEIEWNSPPMVVLLGCETASGKVYRGTGISGFQQYFMTMGAERFLGSLWKIESSHSLRQLKDFIIYWKQTKDPGQALRIVQLESIKKLKMDHYYKYPLPYFWGGYIYSNISIN